MAIIDVCYFPEVEANVSLKSLRLCLLVAATSACASRAPDPVFTPEATPSPSRSSVRRDPNVITQDELSDAKLQSQSVLEAIRLLRPKFLNERPHPKNQNSDPESGRVHASIDNSGVVGLDALATMHVASVAEIRYLNVAQAMQRFGGAAREGPVIVVKTL